MSVASTMWRGSHSTVCVCGTLKAHCKTEYRRPGRANGKAVPQYARRCHRACSLSQTALTMLRNSERTSAAIAYADHSVAEDCWIKKNYHGRSAKTKIDWSLHLARNSRKLECGCLQTKEKNVEIFSVFLLNNIRAYESVARFSRERCV